VFDNSHLIKHFYAGVAAPVFGNRWAVWPVRQSLTPSCCPRSGAAAAYRTEASGSGSGRRPREDQAARL